MMLRDWTHFVFAAGLFLSSGGIRAQEPAPPPPPTIHLGGGPEGPLGAAIAERIELMGIEGFGERKVVKGAAFSAVAVSETVQTLADGNRIHRTVRTNLYRDSEGRTRREVSLPAIGPLALAAKTGATGHAVTTISDPVAHVAYTLESENKVAHKRSHFPPDEIVYANPFATKEEAAQAASELKTESLGTQTICGVNVQGTRYTRTIPAGEIGNEQPIVVVSERWYSPDLQMVVMSKRSDPRFGETTYQFTDIQRGEPAASLFQVPADYSIQEGGPWRIMRERAHPAPLPPPDI